MDRGKTIVTITRQGMTKALCPVEDPPLKYLYVAHDVSVLQT